MEDTSRADRRPYDNRSRAEKAARTAQRIVDAAVEIVHEFETWDWHGLTYRAVAERAGVGERTVYRHYPTERLLHDAVMQRLEEQAGIDYDHVELADLTEVTGRVFAALQRFAVRDSVATPQDPTFVSVGERRMRALLAAVAEAAPDWSDAQQRTAAGLLDVLWHIPTYERLVGPWGLPGPNATRAVTWLMDTVLAAIAADRPPPT